jgi:hypothetical protein
LPPSERTELPRGVSIADQVAELDRLVVHLVDPDTAEPLEPDDRKLLREGLRRNFARLRNWARDEWRRQSKAKGRSPQSLALTRKWVADAKQIDDAWLRTRAIEDIRSALMSKDPERQRAALDALRQLYDVEFDKSGFRELVLPFARRGANRLTAMYALSALGRRPEDLQLALEFVDSESPAERQAASALVRIYSNGDLTGPTGDAVAKLFESNDQQQLRCAINGVCGARISPSIERHLLRLAESEDKQTREDAVHFGLASLRHKSPEVIRRLIEAVGSSDSESSSHALWGLQFGVPEEQGALVASGMKSFFKARSSTDTRTKALRMIGRYGSRDYAPWLKGIINNPQAGERLRKAATEALAQVQRR